MIVYLGIFQTQRAIYMLKIGISNTIAKVPYRTIREILAKIVIFSIFLNFELKFKLNFELNFELTSRLSELDMKLNFLMT